ncbi:MAG: benzoyl-CoA oxygenase subunit B, partial [Rhodospirillaceae bacterium]|nr:benzoyl-CoA oxygenase subunit B [Rhodospirillaceae bacterium]
GDADRPRILQAFNEPTTDWLSFFMFTFFTDRDGRFQLAALAESGFDPLSRTCRFMLTEEAHHMFVGESGVGRVVQRTCEVMRETGDEDLRRQGVIDLPTLQKYLNLHYSLSLDLFGSEVSTNAANYYTGGIKGRFQETKIDDDHRLSDAHYAVPEVGEGGYRTVEAPALNALNERLRDDFIADCQRGVDRWNKIIARHGIDAALTLPHRGFNRGIGAFSGIHVAPDGRIVGEAEWQQRRGEWLPTDDDRAYVRSLMKPVTGPGEMAHWIAAPARGVDGKAIDYEYVRLA